MLQGVFHRHPMLRQELPRMRRCVRNAFLKAVSPQVFFAFGIQFRDFQALTPLEILEFVLTHVGFLRLALIHFVFKPLDLLSCWASWEFLHSASGPADACTSGRKPHFRTSAKPTWGSLLGMRREPCSKAFWVFTRLPGVWSITSIQHPGSLLRCLQATTKHLWVTH